MCLGVSVAPASLLDRPGTRAVEIMLQQQLCMLIYDTN